MKSVVLLLSFAVLAAAAAGDGPNWIAQLGIDGYGWDDKFNYFGAFEMASDDYGDMWDVVDPGGNEQGLVFRGDQSGDNPTYPWVGVCWDIRYPYDDKFKVWKGEVLAEPGYRYDIYYDYDGFGGYPLPDGWICRMDMDGEINADNYTDLALYEVDLGHTWGSVVTGLVHTGEPQVFYVIAGPVGSLTAMFRFYVDKNENGQYDAGEGMPSAEVYYGNRDRVVGVTDGNGYIEIEIDASNDNASVFARKLLYWRNSPRSHHDDVENRMHTLYLDSDILHPWRVAEPLYDDNHLDGQMNRVIAGEEIQIPMSHPVFEWNFTIAIEGDPGQQFVQDLEEGLERSCTYFYNATDGQMKLGKIAIYKDVVPGSEGWRAADVLIHNSGDYHPHCNEWVFGIYQESDWHINMGRDWPSENGAPFGPETENFQRCVIHEFGHYGLGLFDEYLNGAGGQGEDWPYRYSWWWPWNHPEEFPPNYGIMDYTYSASELSSWNDYLPSYDPGVQAHQVTMHAWQYWLRYGGGEFRPCWQRIEDFFNGSYNGWPVKLTPPPPGHWDTVTESSTSDDRTGPTSWQDPYDPVDVTVSPNRALSLQPDQALVSVTSSGSPVPCASVVLVRTGGRNVFLGPTNEDGELLCVGIRRGDRVCAYWCGRGGEATYRGRPMRIELGAGQSDTLGLVIDASVATIPSRDAVITIYADHELVAAPTVTAYPNFGAPLDIPMTPIGDNTYEGNLGLEGVLTGGIEVHAEAVGGAVSDSYGRFALCGVDPERAPMCYGYDGSTELLGQVGSVLGIGASWIFETTALPPADGLGDVEFVRGVRDIRLSDDLESTAQDMALNCYYGDPDVIGLDETQLALMLWDWGNHVWQSKEAQPSPPDNVLCHSVDQFGVFCTVAPLSEDVTAPADILDLWAGSGNTLGRITLAWTAPGDDGDVGTATAYDLRYMKESITDDNWDDAVRLSGVPIPGEAGTEESVFFDMEERGALYYFGLKTVDEAGNLSALSNIASAVSYAPDSDGDGMPDFWETSFGLNPNYSGDAGLDNDEDGLTNLQEYHHRTNPLDEDTDGDGATDGYEVAVGSDPLDPDSHPVAAPQGFFNRWRNWFSIPIDPLDPTPESVLGFDCSGVLVRYDKYLKAPIAYRPPFSTFDLTVGDSYWLWLEFEPEAVSYAGHEPELPSEFKLGRMGWTWLGMPRLEELGYPDFMPGVQVKYPSDDMGTVRTAQEDYNATPDNWIAWSWSFYDSILQAPKTFAPYAPFGNNVCYPWYGYRAWVKTGTATSEDDPDQVTLIWP